jgi:hypothetical protein
MPQAAAWIPLTRRSQLPCFSSLLVWPRLFAREPLRFVGGVRTAGFAVVTSFAWFAGNINWNYVPAIWNADSFRLFEWRWK